jgi:hypothetical protein
MTVGIDTAMRNAARPGAGSVSRATRSSTVPCEALAVSMRGACPDTVIDSSSEPTSSVRSTIRKLWVAMRTAARSTVLKPASATFTRYEPGSTAENAYSPSALLTVARARFVSSLVSVTAAPGTPPSASRTEPRNPP